MSRAAALCGRVCPHKQRHELRAEPQEELEKKNVEARELHSTISELKEQVQAVTKVRRVRFVIRERDARTATVSR